MKVLIIDRDRSTCGECGRGADPYEPNHVAVLGRLAAPDELGCGVQWTHATSHYEGLETAIRGMRPDLKYVTPAEWAAEAARRHESGPGDM